jgi:hypothetical protein
MHCEYDDIRSKIAEPPKWFDENAVPRYSDFEPGQLANIYASECCLLRIECQNCDHEFDVAMSESSMDQVRHQMMFGKIRPHLSDLVRSGDVHYGDPPNAGCCPSGPTMNSIPRRVLQFWRRRPLPAHGWERDSQLEIDIKCDWADEEQTP